MTNRIDHLLLATRAVFEHQLIILRRYWVNTVSLLVTTYVFFALIFFGGRTVAGAAIDDSLGGIVVGYFLFVAVLAAYFGAAKDIQREAQWGTLEQLYMSPHGFGTVLALKSVWNVLWGVGVAGIVLATMLLTTGQRLDVDVLTTLIVMVLSMLSVLGIGFVFAGLSLLYKRIENVTTLMQFVFLGLIATPALSSAEYLAALPLVLGSDMLNQVMTEGTRVTEFPPIDVALLFANGAVYLLGGYLFLRSAIDRAQERGVLGHY